MSRKIISGVIITIIIIVVIMFQNGCYHANRENIFSAIEKGDIEELKELLRKNPDLEITKYNKNVPREMYGYNPTPLISACRNGNEEIVTLLIENGADVNHTDPWLGHTPLQNALAGDNENRFSIAILLIENGADIHKYEGTYSPIERSVTIFETDSKDTIEQGFKLFKYLYENGAEYNFSSYTLFTYACSQNNTNVIKYLLDNGYADVNEENAVGRNGLMEASKRNFSETCNLLLEYGANKYACDNAGKTAIDYAIEFNHNEIIDILR